MKKQLLIFLSFIFPFVLSAQLSTTLNSTDISCFGDSNGTASVIGTIPGAGPPVVISQIDLGSPDYIELTNVSGAPVNTSGWFVITSDDYTNINDVNSDQWNLPASVPAGWVDYREDVSGSNYWGSNLFYNPGNYPSFTGWVLLSDDQGNIVDFVAWEWPETSILNTFNVTAGGFTFDITTAEWTGDGAEGNCTQTVTRDGSSDNDDATDWSCSAGNKGILNGSMTLPFSGTGFSIDYLWSTGDTTNMISDLGPGTYTVTTTGNSTTIIDTVTIIEPPIPPFDLPFEDTVVCSGNALLLDAGSGWDSYSWSNGNTGQNTILTQPGTYSITITDSNNCPAADTFNVDQGITPNVNLGGDSTICADEWLLNAGTGVSYIWNTGGTSQTWTASATGNYAVTVTSADGCIGVDEVNLTLFPVPDPDLGDNFTLCYNFNQTSFLTTGGSYAIYQWDNGSTNPNRLVGNGVTSAGTQNYSVTVTDQNGCVGSDTIKVTFANCVGTGENAQVETWNVYPNPANDFVLIESNDGKLERIELFDITGKLISRKAAASSSNQTRLDLSEVEAGTYFLKLFSNEHEEVVRCVVQ